MNTSKSRASVLVWGALVALALTGPRAVAQDPSTFTTPTPDKKGYTINYEALAKAQGLTDAQKLQVARALRKGPEHVADHKVEDIAGLSGKCSIEKKVFIPVGVDCTLTANPTATKVLAGLGTFALTNAICLVVDVEDGEITEPICDILLEVVAQKTIEPVLDQCADKGQSTSISIGFKLIPPAIKGPSASCQ